VQSRLLAAVETKRHSRIGDTRQRRSDFRLIASSRSDLAPRVVAGRFQAALLSSFSAATIAVAPLRAAAVPSRS
jgi:DNA-binding NtrC family response regulator